MSLASRLLLCPMLVFGVTVAIADEPDAAASASSPIAPATLQTLNEARDLFVNALKSQNKDRLNGLSQAYQKLAKAASEDASLPPARTMWAKMLIKVGDQKSALASLQQAVSESPEDPEAYVLLANQAVLEGRLAEAKLTYDAAARLTTGLAEANQRQAGLQAQIQAGLAAVAQARSSLSTQSKREELANEYDQTALTHLKQWVAVAPENASAHDRLAVALFKAGNLDAATQSFDKARSLNPKLPLTELRLAQSHVTNGDRMTADESLQRAVAAHPDDAGVQTSAADMWLVMGKRELAAKHLDRALQMVPGDLNASRLHAQLLRFEGQWEDAAKELQTLSNQHPTDFETANLLALTLTELDAEDAKRRALSVATVTAQRFDQNTAEGRRARISLIWAAYTAGNVDVAKQGLNQLLSTGIRSNQISGDEGFFLSRLLVEFGRPELASPTLASLLARVGDFPKRADAEALLGQLK